MYKEQFLYKSVKSPNAEVTMRLAFPGIYSFSMSSLGYLWMFKCIDELDDVNIERITSDTKASFLRRESIDLYGFSFSFDMDFLTIFYMIEKYGYSLKASERGDHQPLIFAGGPVVTANPTPYSEIFDFFIIGDGEDINLQIVETCKQNKGKPKETVLKLLSELDGVWVPKFGKYPVKKCTKKLSSCIYTPILSEDAFFKNTFIVEAARGCTNRCGFCLASYLNLPFRFLPYEELIKVIEFGLQHTDKIALLGAQISAHPNFKEICDYIYKRIQNGEHIEMSVSSLRVDAITSDVVRTLVAAGQKNSTLAIEAGSERLRKVINKNVSEEQIFNAVKISKENGLKGLKFYGMLGLPTETEEDLNEIIRLAKSLKTKFKGFDISFGFSTFVPKPHTPFQWCAREQTKSLELKSDFIKKELHKIGVKVNVSSIKWDYWQTVLSRGDDTFGDFLIDVYKTGGKIGAFKSAARQHNINTDYYAYTYFGSDAEFPWNFIEIQSPGKDFLRQENKRLMNYVMPVTN